MVILNMYVKLYIYIFFLKSKTGPVHTNQHQDIMTVFMNGLTTQYSLQGDVAGEHDGEGEDKGEPTSEPSPSEAT